MAVKYNNDEVMPLADQEVLVSFDEDATVGDNGLFGPEWFTVGILVDDSELDIGRGLDEEEISGKGRGVVARRYKPGAVTGAYEVMSNNKVTDFIAFPDRVIKGNVELERHTSKVARLMTAYVNVREDGIVEVRVSRIPATHRMEALGRNETPAGKQVSVGFIPDAETKVVFEKFTFKVKEDGTMVEITPKVVVPQAEIPEHEDNYQAGGGKPDGVITPEKIEGADEEDTQEGGA
ncbi:hypothetical protein [Corynebacterium cystitidis]|uniref:hypothetical protein n=1 Tax=Corynebacterium cystitidis TaxID=35757 RepID=UPI00211F3BE4|nr:hypothetical protein [Corynebacterium cystitidis]